MADALNDVGGGAAVGTSIMPGWGTVIGAGLGLGKYLLMDKPQQKKQLELAAATQRYSPWTGLQAEQVAPINPVSDTLGGAEAGYAQQQKMQNDVANKDFLLKLSQSQTPAAKTLQNAIAQQQAPQAPQAAPSRMLNSQPNAWTNIMNSPLGG